MRSTIGSCAGFQRVDGRMRGVCALRKAREIAALQFGLASRARRQKHSRTNEHILAG